MLSSQNTLIIKKDSDFFIVNSNIEVIAMNSMLCNASIEHWNLNVYPVLKSLVIGDNCLQILSGFVLNNMKQLVKVSFGCGCCTKGSGNFVVMNCPALKKLTVGGLSFPLFDEFCVKKCRELSSIDISTNCFEQCNSVSLEGLYSCCP